MNFDGSFQVESGFEPTTLQAVVRVVFGRDRRQHISGPPDVLRTLADEIYKACDACEACVRTTINQQHVKETSR